MAAVSPCRAKDKVAVPFLSLSFPLRPTSWRPRRLRSRKGRRSASAFAFSSWDDNLDLADLLSVALQMEGFQTAVAHDAQGALDRWRTFVPHAAVLDVGLPGFDGYELAKALRTEYGSDPALIAATGYGQQQDRQHALDAGFACHFVKPVSIQALVMALDQRVVGRPAIRRRSDAGGDVPPA